VPIALKNFRSLPRHKIGWTEIMFANETLGLSCPDGQLFIVALADASPHLQSLPHDKQGWFFNESRDRYCAEPWPFSDIPAVSLNPGWACRTFGPIVIG
jgi:hypothetical protein